MSLELISFKLCPFVQRAVITLNYKGVEHDVTYIDLADPPAWFLEISPLGKVPVLKVDGEILFESAVINEFLDDITGGDLQPEDPLLRAKNRAWIEIASNMLGNSYMMKIAQNEEDYQKHRETQLARLQMVENQLGEGAWFNGDDFSLVDTSFAPLFTHDAVADGQFSLLSEGGFPKLAAWAKRLLELPAVQQSVVGDFETLYLAALQSNDSYVLQKSAA
ncbi:MAG: glutathione S-transferase family protein [Pseudomonadota bacterium]